MQNQYLIKYSTLDELLDSVRDDFENIDAEGFIDVSKLIKVVKTINKKLGLKLHKDHNTMLEVCNYKAKLPDNFYKLNYATLCTSWSVIEPKIEGRYTEEMWVQLECKRNTNDKYITLDGDDVHLCGIYINESGDGYTVMERKRNEIKHYSHTDLCKIKSTPNSFLSDSCYSNNKSINEITVQDNYIYTNFNEGNLYISYIGDLVDKDNNILILDHPMVNEYYEYALKRRILENMYLDNTEDVVQKLNLVEQRYKEAKKTAHRLVDTPEFSELEAIWKNNRREYHNRFIKPITG